MAQYTAYLTYIIYFWDYDEFLFAVEAVGGTPTGGAAYIGSPMSAAAAFGIPIPLDTSNMYLQPKGVVYNFTYKPGAQLNDFAPPSVILNDTDDEFLVPGHYDSGTRVQGADILFQWQGLLLCMSGTADPGEEEVTIPQRRWIGGLEISGIGGVPGGEGGTSRYGYSRDSSRTVDGFGIPIRGNNTGGNSWSRSPTEYTGVGVYQSWERMYFRPRVLPTGVVGFWRCHGSGSPAAGAMLVYTPAGCLAVYTISATSAGTLRYTSPVLPLYAWYKIDIVFEFPSSGAFSGNIFLYVNGMLLFSYTDSTNDAMDTVGFHSLSDLGKGCGIGAFGGTDATVEYDLDDWINAAWPLLLGAFNPTSPDFILGSHVRHGISKGATAALYTPAAPLIINHPINPTMSANAELTSATSGALIEGLVDLPPIGEQDKMGELGLGAVAALISIQSRNAAGTDGQLGYNVAGAGNVMATIDELSSNEYRTVMYNPSGQLVPLEVNPFIIRYTKSADANSAFVRELNAVFEYIGIWGDEDTTQPPTSPDDRPRINNVHNCRYPNTAYGYLGPTLETPCYVQGGVYVGNGTYQEILLPDACHMIFIRALTGGSSGVKWFAASLGGHIGVTEAFRPNLINRVWYDQINEAFKFSVAGSHVENNALGVSYQYIAFCDPGMRFSVCGAYNIPDTVAARVNLLQNPGLLPGFAFIQHEVESASSVSALFVRGPGHSGSDGSNLNTAIVVNNLCTFAQGQLITGFTAHDASVYQCNFIVFRSTEECANVMAQIFTYTGDGLGTRVIPLVPATLNYPLFVLVCPTSGGQVAVFRDPSHTGVNSATFNNLTNLTTGITAGGIDSITVGSALNVTDVVYNVFAIPGSPTGWNNGTFYPPNCLNSDPWFDPPLEIPDIILAGNGGVIVGGSTPLTLLRDVSGIYTLIPGRRHDTLIDRPVSGAIDVDVKIPDPIIKTGYIGG